MNDTTMNDAMTNHDELRESLVSVVVCTHNRAALLADALLSLTRLRTTDQFAFEIVVVDNRSTDETQAVVERLAGQSPGRPIRYVFEPELGIVAARNCGIASAAGDWIAFFDDDQLADPAWLVELMACAKRHRVLYAGGQIRLQQTGDSGRTLGPVCRDLLSEKVASEARQFDRRFQPSTGNLLVHRLALDAVGRFEDAFENRGEDVLLFLKLSQFGYTGWYQPTAIVHHIIPDARITDAAMVQLAQFVGRQMPKLEKHHRQMMFPFFWSARVVMMATVVGPRYVAAMLSGNPDRMLDAKCRWVMETRRVWHGVRYLFTRQSVLPI